MAEEPNPELHHIYKDYVIAKEFYDKLLYDESISEEVREEIKSPRQGLNGTWLIDKVR
jgi:hypothetical protein